MLVYVVEKGQYSDRHVVAIKESLEEAENVAKMLRAYTYSYCDDDVEVYEYDTNAFDLWPDGYELYKVYLDKNYNITEVKRVPKQDEDDDDFDLMAYDLGYSNIGEFEYPDFYIYAINEEHALKIASDKVAEHKYRKLIGE